MPLMDIHGTRDDIIPQNISNGYQPGGPMASTVSADGYYYTPTLNVTEVSAADTAWWWCCCCCCCCC